MNKYLFRNPKIFFIADDDRTRKRNERIYQVPHLSEKLEFALAIAQNKGDEKRSIILKKKIVELERNVEEKVLKRELIKGYLVESGFDVLAKDVKNSEVLVTNYLPDLFLFDSSMEGLKLARKLRRDERTSKIPILRITSLPYLKYLNYGVDENIKASPYIDLEELKKLINNILFATENGQLNSNFKLEILNYGPLTLFPERYEAIWFNSLIRLTEIEFELIYHLLQRHNQILSKPLILKKIWGNESTNIQKISSHIKNLRTKLEPNPKEPKYINTIFGEGYCLRLPQNKELKNKL